MKGFFHTRCLAITAVFGLLWHPAHGRHADPPQGPAEPFLELAHNVPKERNQASEKLLDPATLSAFERLGAEFHRLKVGLWKDDPDGGLPVFRFKELPNGKLPKLPEVAIPFGLRPSRDRA